MMSKETFTRRKKYMTALLYCGTPEGFVIGADGRVFNKQTQQPETENAQKIFSFESASAVSVVFGWCGVLQVQLQNSGAIFDFIQATYDILPQVDIDERFASEFNARLQVPLRYLGTNTTGEHARGVFLFYLKGTPFVSEVTVSKNGRHFVCRYETGFPNGEIEVVSGGDVSGKSHSLNEARNSIEKYIQDCSADPKRPDIGGQIHIGKLTTEGFDWIIPPK